jgi:hypothetical protein
MNDDFDFDDFNDGDEGIDDDFGNDDENFQDEDAEFIDEIPDRDPDPYYSNRSHNGHSKFDDWLSWEEALIIGTGIGFEEFEEERKRRKRRRNLEDEDF